jgi:hypothetical protein
LNLRNTATTVLFGNASYLVVTTDGVYAFDDVQVSAGDLSKTTYTYMRRTS